MYVLKSMRAYMYVCIYVYVCMHCCKHARTGACTVKSVYVCDSCVYVSLCVMLIRLSVYMSV